ncbi:G-protein coupled receptor family C group 5 member D-like [Arapaima gigas]
MAWMKVSFSLLLHSSLSLLLVQHLPLLTGAGVSSSPLPSSTSSAPPTSATTSVGASSASKLTRPTASRAVSMLASSSAQLVIKAPGCQPGFNPAYTDLCDTTAAWGIVVESLATLGFVVTVGLVVAVVGWTTCGRLCGATVACGETAPLLLFLLSTGGIFGLSFAFVINLTPQTCPTRVFLFGVLYSLAFSALLSRCLALQEFCVARGWGEVGLTLALSTIQVIIATEWLTLVLVRDQNLCFYTQGEFVMLLIYVLCLLAMALVTSVRCLFHCSHTYSFSYTDRTHRQAQHQYTALCVSLILSMSIWVTWITLLTWGDREMGWQPAWDDPVLSIALVTNGWVLLLGHGVAQMVFLCRSETSRRESSATADGQISLRTSIPGLGYPRMQKKWGIEDKTEKERGERRDQIPESPYESAFIVTDIDPKRDYSIPRPRTTNRDELYDEYSVYSIAE